MERSLFPQWSKLGEFSQLCYDALVWEDGTLVRSLGVCLATTATPMTLIQEYFSLGPLNKYLQENSPLLQVKRQFNVVFFFASSGICFSSHSSKYEARTLQQTQDDFQCQGDGRFLR